MDDVASDVEGREDGRGASGSGDNERKSFGSFVFVMMG
jgi:hypothetical protein